MQQFNTSAGRPEPLVSMQTHDIIILVILSEIDGRYDTDGGHAKDDTNRSNAYTFRDVTQSGDLQEMKVNNKNIIVYINTATNFPLDDPYHKSFSSGSTWE